MPLSSSDTTVSAIRNNVRMFGRKEYSNIRKIPHDSMRHRQRSARVEREAGFRQLAAIEGQAGEGDDVTYAASDEDSSAGTDVDAGSIDARDADRLVDGHRAIICGIKRLDLATDARLIDCELERTAG